VQPGRAECSHVLEASVRACHSVHGVERLGVSLRDLELEQAERLCWCIPRLLWPYSCRAGVQWLFCLLYLILCHSVTCCIMILSDSDHFRICVRDAYSGKELVTFWSGWRHAWYDAWVFLFCILKRQWLQLILVISDLQITVRVLVWWDDGLLLSPVFWSKYLTDAVVKAISDRWRSLFHSAYSWNLQTYYDLRLGWWLFDRRLSWWWLGSCVCLMCV